MLEKKKKQSTEELPPITADMKVSELLNAYPEALDVMVKIGFGPLKSPAAQKTIAKVTSLKQAADFRGFNLAEMLSTIKKELGIEVSENKAAPASETVVPEQDIVPELKGDITYLGLVPCPIRGILIDKFDTFVQKFTASTGITVAWWMAGEGAGARDVKPWISWLSGKRDFAHVPDIFMAIGTEVFLHKKYGKLIYDEDVFVPFSLSRKPRPDLKNLDDPHGILSLQFAATFVFSCRPENLPDGLLPKTWADLAKPEFKGQVAIPSIDLPIIPDLLSALYHYLGAELFESLASNIGSALHPAVSSPREGVRDVPGVFIVPELFAKVSVTSGAINIMPEDGPVAIPGFMAIKHNAGKEAIAVAEFLNSHDFLEPFWTFASFIPNCEDIKTDRLFDNIITRPWETVFNENPDAESNRLIEMVQKGFMK